MTSQQLVWLITGTSSGFGREFAEQLLERGDIVIATARARSFPKIADLKDRGADTYELDVNASQPVLDEFAKTVIAKHGRVDVLVNNAGFVEIGPLEVVTPEKALGQFSTNVLAPLNMNRAFLPYMREHRKGTIVWIGSLSGWLASPGNALYSGTKHAVRALSASLDQELSSLGIRSLCFEAGAFRTPLLSSENCTRVTTTIADYEQLVGLLNGHIDALSGNQTGDPKKAVKLMIDIVKGEGLAAGRTIPSVIAIGTDSYNVVKKTCEDALKRIEEWKDVSCSTDLA